MEKKTKSILDSLWFNIIMSLVAVIALGEKLYLGYQSGSYQYIRIIIWVIIAYHFIRKVAKNR